MIDWNKVVTGIVTVAALAAITAIFKFQSVEGRVADLEKGSKSSEKKLSVLSWAMCEWAKDNKRPNADRMCRHLIAPWEAGSNDDSTN